MHRNTVVKFLVPLAWVSVGLVAFATLTHVGFVYAIYFKIAPLLKWPEMTTYAHFEHVLAFAFLGVVFGFAYPRNLVLVCFVVFGGAALLEILQTFTPDRHGTLNDAVEKLAGGAGGIIVSKIALIAGRKRRTGGAQ